MTSIEAVAGQLSGDLRPGEGKRLLVVSYHFPPDGAVGGLRWAGLTKYLARLGWRCWVVTSATGSASSEPGVTVIRVPQAKTLNARLLEYRAGRRPPSPHAEKSAVQTPTPARSVPKRTTVIGYLRREMGFLLTVPDEGRGWVFRAARRTRRLIHEIQPHALVSSGPPHSAHVAAWLATRFNAAPWFVDLRDPWAGPIAEAWREFPRFQSPVFMGVNRVLERAAITSASGVICNTREFAAALGRRYAGLTARWVPNAVDRETLPGADAARFPGMALVYVGTIYGGRDLTPVLRGLRRFLDQVPSAAPGTKVRIAGDIDGQHLDHLWQTVDSLNLHGRIEVLGRLPRDEALRIVTRSRVAIVLAQQQDWQVPAKLYEMVGLGMPTIVVAGEHSAAASEARRLGAIAAPPHDEKRMAEILRQVWTQEPTPSQTRQQYADYASLAPEMGALLAGQGESVSRDAAPLGEGPR